MRSLESRQDHPGTAGDPGLFRKFFYVIGCANGFEMGSPINLSAKHHFCARTFCGARDRWLAKTNLPEAVLAKIPWRGSLGSRRRWPAAAHSEPFDGSNKSRVSSYPLMRFSWKERSNRRILSYRPIRLGPPPGVARGKTLLEIGDPRRIDYSHSTTTCGVSPINP